MSRRGWWGDRGPRRHARGEAKKDSRSQVVAHELRADDYEQRARRDAIKAIRAGVPVVARWDGHFAWLARAELELVDGYRRATKSS